MKTRERVRTFLLAHPKFASRTLYLRFIVALITGRFVTLRESESPGSLRGWSEESLRHVIDEGRRQLDDQMATLDRILLRAQILFSTSLALIALLSSSAESLLKDVKPRSFHFIVMWLLIFSATIFLLVLLGSASLIAIKKPYNVISIAVIASWVSFGLEHLAQEYVEAIGPGDEVNNAHLTILTTAVRMTVCGSMLFGIALLLPHI